MTETIDHTVDGGIAALRQRLHELYGFLDESYQVLADSDVTVQHLRQQVNHIADDIASTKKTIEDLLNPLDQSATTLQRTVSHLNNVDLNGSTTDLLELVGDIMRLSLQVATTASSPHTMDAREDEASLLWFHHYWHPWLQALVPYIAKHLPFAHVAANLSGVTTMYDNTLAALFEVVKEALLQRRTSIAPNAPETEVSDSSYDISE